MKGVLKFLLRRLLRWRRLAAALHGAAVEAHPELGEFRAPLSEGLSAVLPDGASAYSFGEIFVEREYEGVLELLPELVRWIDLGCHCGFFSLWLEWERRRAGLRGGSAALLVDADPLGVARSRRLMEENGLGERFRVVHGAVWREPGEAVFEQRPFMASSLKRFDARPAVELRVPVLTAEGILAELPPPYDLVKIDVEGAEAEFFESYKAVTERARAVVVEWHSWNSARADGDALAGLLAAEGFGVRRTLRGPMPAAARGPEAWCGVELFVRG